ncbi:MAG: box helicase protein [Armatimonadetes bacterium]|jgi:ATP-dependent RNA helicase DeaD|nr:box helicase protein [Armatimonadota bacterium]
MSDTPIDTTPLFSDLGLSPETLRSVEQAGYERPTPIQAKAIPVLLSGADMVGQAQTGTGKTAAFALPLIDLLDADRAVPQALILCPTRELAVQVSEAIYGLGRGRGFRVVPVYGGQPIDRQLRALRSGPQIVVGTPGRLLDHLRRKTLDLSSIRTVILDEADEMLAMGFIEDIELILDELPAQRQTALFSATIPPPIARLSQKYLSNPQQVKIASERHTIPQIRQCYYEVLPSHKIDALARILDMETPGPTIIFCRTRRESDEVSEHLRGRGYLAESLHGDMSQPERDRVMRRFRAGQVDLLVATDVAARGLDIETVTHVINYDIPWDVESYTHRIGRTGRAGREGDAITLISPRERRQLKVIERATGSRITPVKLPTSADIAVRRREMFKEKVVGVLQEGEFDDFLQTVEELSEEFEASEVAAAALKLLWGQEKREISARPMEDDGTRAEPGMVRLFVTVGRQEGLRPTDLVGAIANEAGIPGHSIGTIDILDHCAFVEVPADAADRVVRALLRTKIRGRRVRVEKAPPGAEHFMPESAPAGGAAPAPNSTPDSGPFRPKVKNKRPSVSVSKPATRKFGGKPEFEKRAGDKKAG